MTDIGEPCPNGLYECAKDNLGDFHTVTFPEFGTDESDNTLRVEMYPRRGDGGGYKFESDHHGEQLVIHGVDHLYRAFRDAVESTISDMQHQTDTEHYVRYVVGSGVEAEFHTDAYVLLL